MSEATGDDVEAMDVDIDYEHIHFNDLGNRADEWAITVTPGLAPTIANFELNKLITHWNQFPRQRTMGLGLAISEQAREAVSEISPNADLSKELDNIAHVVDLALENMTD